MSRPKKAPPRQLAFGSSTSTATAATTTGTDTRGAVVGMERINRKSLIYKSGLGFFCINHVQGCSHGCRYPCYAFMMAKHYGRVSDYSEWRRPRLVGNALALLERELNGKFRSLRNVHLCLTTDPFMVSVPEVGALSLEIVELLNRHNVTCSLLTKGVLPIALADRSRFGAENEHGISLVSLDEEFRRRWEPGASPYAERIAALRRLHEAGCRTHAHIEPYPTPNLIEQDLSALLEAVSFVDHVFWGRWNYNARATAYPSADAFYGAQAQIVRRFCRQRGIDCEIGSTG
jgi:DNA repair photolyase